MAICLIFTRRIVIVMKWTKWFVQFLRLWWNGYHTRFRLSRFGFESWWARQYIHKLTLVDATTRVFICADTCMKFYNWILYFLSLNMNVTNTYCFIIRFTLQTDAFRGHGLSPLRENRPSWSSARAIPAGVAVFRYNRIIMFVYSYKINTYENDLPT